MDFEVLLGGGKLGILEGRLGKNNQSECFSVPSNHRKIEAAGLDFFAREVWGLA